MRNDLTPKLSAFLLKLAKMYMTFGSRYMLSKLAEEVKITNRKNSF